MRQHDGAFSSDPSYLGWSALRLLANSIETVHLFLYGAPCVAPAPDGWEPLCSALHVSSRSPPGDKTLWGKLQDGLSHGRVNGLHVSWARCCS
jgi:hypothetical protein